MKRLGSSLLLIVFGFLSCTSVPEVGLGVLHFEEQVSQRLDFYNQPNADQQPAFYFDMIYEEGRFETKSSLNRESDTLEFNPLYARFGKGLFTLQVLEQQGDWFKVYTDDIVLVTHWVRLPGREVESFRSFLPTTHTVSTVDRGSNPLRESPHDDAQAYGLSPNSYCLKVLEVQGAWLKVQNDSERCPKDSHPIQEQFEGFLRWKRGGDILIFLVL